MNLKSKLRMLLKGESGREIWRILHITNIFIQRIMPDEQYFKWAYKKNSGLELDFQNPKTFDEKQLWIKMYYRDPLYTKCSDKYLVRDYVKSKGLGHILNTLYGVYDPKSGIEWEKLPKSFYLKANNSSGVNLRCDDIQTFDKKAAENYFKKEMRINPYYNSREWNYRDIHPRIIAEAILETNEKTGLVDYRFLCYDGKCEFVFIDIDTADTQGHHRLEAKRNVYDRDMNFLDVTVTRERFPEEWVSKPSNWDEMINYSEILSEGFPFCRVDLYNIKGKIIFGEMTFFHSGGLSVIEPAEWQIILGKDIPIDRLMKEKNLNH